MLLPVEFIKTKQNVVCTVSAQNQKWRLVKTKHHLNGGLSCCCSHQKMSFGW